jgi:hypothetical protein
LNRINAMRSRGCCNGCRQHKEVDMDIAIVLLLNVLIGALIAAYCINALIDIQDISDN